MSEPEYYSKDYHGKLHIQRPAYPHIFCCGAPLTKHYTRDSRTTLPEDRYCIKCGYNFPRQILRTALAKYAGVERKEKPRRLGLD